MRPLLRLAFLLLASALVSASGLGASAAPVAPGDRIPLDLRRTTLIVRDMETSLKFYRDALGMQVAYDHVIRTPRDAASDDAATRSLRLVLLRANDDFVGMLGLLQYTKPAPEPRPIEHKAFRPGDIVLLFNARDLDQRFARAKASPGVKIESEPTETSYPSYDGKGVIRVRVSTLFDPDGYFVELNQLLDDLR